jgi:hypothetical protein
MGIEYGRIDDVNPMSEGFTRVGIMIIFRGMLFRFVATPCIDARSDMMKPKTMDFTHPTP